MSVYDMCSDFVPVYFDLEATGGGEWDELIQIAATTKRSRNIFCRYMLPYIIIPEKITRLTGFRIFQGNLYWHNKIRRTTPLSNALEDFLHYLQQFKKPVILVAHNCFSFDSRFILKFYKRCGLLNELSEVVQGFCDSLPLFRKYIPGMQSYKLENLVRELVWPNFIAHEAVNDAKGLAAIFRLKKLTLQQILEGSHSFDEMDQKRNLQTLKPLGQFVSLDIRKKMAQYGLDLELLQDHLRYQGRTRFEQWLSLMMDVDMSIVRDICNGVQCTMNY